MLKPNWSQVVCFLAVILSACQAPLPGPVAPPAAASPVGTAPSFGWLGTARIQDRPLAGADVRLISPDKQELWSTATTDAQGRFHVTAPAGARQKGLLTVLARKGEITLATLVATDTADRPFATQAEATLRLDGTTTLAYVTLIQQVRTTIDTPAFDFHRAMQAFQSVLASITLPASEQAPPAWLQSVTVLLDSWGQGQMPAGTASQAMSDMPAFRQAFLSATTGMLAGVSILVPVAPPPAPGGGGGGGGGDGGTPTAASGATTAASVTPIDGQPITGSPIGVQ